MKNKEIHSRLATIRTQNGRDYQDVTDNDEDKENAEKHYLMSLQQKTHDNRKQTSLRLPFELKKSYDWLTIDWLFDNRMCYFTELCSFFL